jgi:hypothetical protein
MKYEVCGKLPKYPAESPGFFWARARTTLRHVNLDSKSQRVMTYRLWSCRGSQSNFPHEIESSSTPYTGISLLSNVMVRERSERVPEGVRRGRFDLVSLDRLTIFTGLSASVYITMHLFKRRVEAGRKLLRSLGRCLATVTHCVAEDVSVGRKRRRPRCFWKMIANP